MVDRRGLRVALLLIVPHDLHAHTQRPFTQSLYVGYVAVYSCLNKSRHAELQANTIHQYYLLGTTYELRFGFLSSLFSQSGSLLVREILIVKLGRYLGHLASSGSRSSTVFLSPFRSESQTDSQDSKLNKFV